MSRLPPKCVDQASGGDEQRFFTPALPRQFQDGIYGFLRAFSIKAQVFTITASACRVVGDEVTASRRPRISSVSIRFLAHPQGHGGNFKPAFHQVCRSFLIVLNLAGYASSRLLTRLLP